jgi:hypothetical protein
MLQGRLFDSLFLRKRLIIRRKRLFKKARRKIVFIILWMLWLASFVPPRTMEI